MKMLKKSVAAICVVAVILVVAWLIARQRLVASIGYNMYDAFAAMPADDSAFESWLVQQPGVVKAHLFREGNKLTIDFIQVRNLAGHPKLPELDKQAALLNYSGGAGFRDVR